MILYVSFLIYKQYEEGNYLLEYGRKKRKKRKSLERAHIFAFCDKKKNGEDKRTIFFWRREIFQIKDKKEQQGADERRLMFAIVQHFWSLFLDSDAQSPVFGHVWPRALKIVPSCHSGRGEHRVNWENRGGMEDTENMEKMENIIQTT